MTASALPATARAWIALAIALAVTSAVYAPGLNGGFVYDDSAFIVGNVAVHVADSKLGSWTAAAFSFPGGAHQGRWLGMLTFAANYAAGGLDPRGYKLVNLCIHLLNGVLLFLMLRELFAWRDDQRDSEASIVDPHLAAAMIAALWMVLPINLTGVLYVAQRLEALSTTFVLLGLWLYLRARREHWRTGKGGRSMWASLVLCTGAGMLVKESAILLPLYAACTEWALGRGKTATGSWSRPTLWLYAFVLLLPAAIGTAWLLSWVFGPLAYARPFGTGARLLTEARVLVEYIVWTLAPSLDSLTLYHDDIAVSRSLFDPWTTAASIAALAALVIGALVSRVRRPLFSIGVLWFFCGHLLTATIIPLLLAFEHRNYFPSAGLLVACASLLALDQDSRRVSLRTQTLVFFAVAAFYGLTTWMRAQEWSDPARLSISEAAKRPSSPLAQYDKAATLLATVSPEGLPKAREEAMRVLDQARHLDGAGISFEQALIELSIEAGRSADPDWYEAILRKLRRSPPSLQDTRALQYLNECFAKRACKPNPAFLDEAYAAAMRAAQPSALLYYVHSQYAAYLKNDYERAASDLRQTIAMAPFDANAREALVTILLQSGKPAEARAEVDRMRRANSWGIFDNALHDVEKSMQSVK
jgi:hypothetical protein